MENDDKAERESGSPQKRKKSGPLANRIIIVGVSLLGIVICVADVWQWGLDRAVPHRTVVRLKRIKLLTYRILPDRSGLGGTTGAGLKIRWNG